MLNIFQYLQDNKGKSIPFLFKIINNLPLKESELIIDANIDLWHSKISYLPDKLTVLSHLDIGFTNISELPDNLYVGGDLWCGYTPLAHKIKNDESLLTKYQKQVKGTIIYE